MPPLSEQPLYIAPGADALEYYAGLTTLAHTTQIKGVHVEPGDIASVF